MLVCLFLRLILAMLLVKALESKLERDNIILLYLYIRSSSALLGRILICTSSRLYDELAHAERENDCVAPSN